MPTHYKLAEKSTENNSDDLCLSLYDTLLYVSRYTAY